MSNPRTAITTLSLCLVAACASAERGEMDPDIEAQKSKQLRDQAAQVEKQEQFERVLLRLDTAMDSYVEAVSRDEFKRAQQLAEKLEKFLREEVTEHFDSLIRTADQSEHVPMRARAVGALGFSKRREALDPLLNALKAEDNVVVNNAVFALGTLQDLRTPPAAIADILEDPTRSPEMRMNAAWALVQVQEVLLEPERVRPVWLRVLSQPEGTVEPWVLVQAIRGMGLMRSPEDAKSVEPYVSHSTPRIRISAAIALGRMGNPDSHVALIARLEESETNQNVRLAVQKALQALAGGTTETWDVEEWRRVFDRGPQKKGTANPEKRGS